MTTTSLKYIAEGFHEDSDKLLEEFTVLSTVEFSKFKSLWKKHYFSLVFMGRPDETEMCEFTNEIFRITSHHLSSPLFYKKIGAVYMLYGLFVNQIFDPPVKIRIVMNKLKIIRTLQAEAILKKYTGLIYAINYLINHGFVYVLRETLKGPLTGNTGIMLKPSRHQEALSNLTTTCMTDLQKFSVSNKLAVLQDLQTQYLAEKKKVAGYVKVNLNQNPKIYEEAINELEELVNPSEKKKKEGSVGRRRAKIKADSFIKKSKNRFGIVPDEDIETEEQFISDDIVSPPKVKVRSRRPRRTPKELRRVGRPRKKPKQEPTSEPKSDGDDDDEDDIDISHLLPQQSDFYLPPPVTGDTKKLRTKRIPYYESSPRREETDSDTDNSS